MHEPKSEGSHEFNVADLLVGMTTEARKQLADLLILIQEQKETNRDDSATLAQIEGIKSDIEHATAELPIRLERDQEPYLADPELAELLDDCYALGKPVMLIGEPGTGKTAAAYAYAAEHGMQVIDLQCRESVDASEALYSIRYLDKWSDAQSGTAQAGYDNYIQLGPIGQAFMSDEPVVLLIDEADKLAEGGPDAWLRAFEDFAFVINEGRPTSGVTEKVSAEQRIVKAKHKPLIIITSNGMRDFSSAFLRRCGRYSIPFPDSEKLKDIVKLHIPDMETQLLDNIISEFMRIRETEGLKHKPSPAELLDWIRVLRRRGVSDVSQGNLEALHFLIKEESDMQLFDMSKVSPEVLHKSGMPIEVVHAINGRHLVQLNSAQPKDLLLQLYRKKIKFSGTATYSDPLFIQEPGCHTVIGSNDMRWYIVTPAVLTVLNECNAVGMTMRSINEDELPEVTDFVKANKYFQLVKLVDGNSAYIRNGKAVIIPR